MLSEEMADRVNKGCPMALSGALSSTQSRPRRSRFERRVPTSRPMRRESSPTRTLAEACIRLGMPVLTGGSDNHLLLIDVAKGSVSRASGRKRLQTVRRDAESKRDSIRPQRALVSSGLRVGTPAVTTLGMKETEMREIAEVLNLVLTNVRPAAGAAQASKYTLDNHDRRSGIGTSPAAPRAISPLSSSIST